MPRPSKPEQWSVRLNFTMSREDARLIRELAELVAPPGTAPNASLAVRIAVRREFLRRKARRAQEPV